MYLSLVVNRNRELQKAQRTLELMTAENINTNAFTKSLRQQLDIAQSENE